MYWFVGILLFISFLLYLTHLYTSRNFDYWKNKNVPFIEPRPFVGNMLDALLQKYDMGGFFRMMYEKMDGPFFGIFLFSKPALIVKDVDLLRHILVTDFDNFMDRYMYAPEHEPAIAHMLFVEKGQKWRTLRQKTSRFFSFSKVKTMFNAMEDVATLLCNYIQANGAKADFDVKDVTNRYAVDIIAKCVLSIHSKSLEIEDGVFFRIAHRIFDARFITSFRFMCYFFFHSFARLFKMRLVDFEVVRFVRRVLWESIKVREEQNMKANDLVDIIVDLRKNKDSCELLEFEGDAVTAQALQFFIAGIETTSYTIAFTLYPLCLNLDIQRKLRENIRDVMKKHDGKLTVESIEEIVYLEMVIKETLRKYNPIPIIERVCTRDYKIPGTDIIIEKGTMILLPIYGIQNDPQYYDKPQQYIPERFETMKEDLFYSPFGHGPRSCIGKRFALLAIKIAIVRILREFEVHSTKDTPNPVIFSTKSVVPQPTRNLSVKFMKVDPLF